MGALQTVWQTKGQWVRTFAHEDAIMVCTSSAIRSQDPATGKELAKIKWKMCGEPWLDDGLLWIPTTKGYDVAAPATLKITRTVVTPKPKGATNPLAFYGTFDRVIGGTSYRVAKPNAPKLEFFLQAFDVAGKQERYAKCIATTDPVGASCAATADSLVLAHLDGYKNDKQGHRYLVSLANGSVIGEEPFTAPKDMRASRSLSSDVKAIGPHLIAFPTAHVQPAVLENSKWRTIGFDGNFVAVNDQIYGIGHRQLVRFDKKWGIAAKLELDSPPRADEYMMGPDASVLAVGKDLLVARRTSEWPTTPPYSVELSVRRAMSLKWRGEPSTLQAPGGSRLVASKQDVLIFAGPQGHLAVRGDWS